MALFDTADVAAAVQARAKREAQAMRKLGDHPHVVSVLDTGEEDGNPFIVSEYMPGGDVESLLAAEGGSIEAERAAGIAADVTRALEHAHARGIVHRDLKPANIWLDDDGAARLGDFGLATTEGRSRVSGGNLVGTVAYLPPEQALGDTSGPESDLYSLGALLYEMLTGQPPFAGDDAVSIISQHLHADPVPPSRHEPGVPQALDRVVLELLAKRGEDRPDGAAAVRDSLEAALAEEPAAEVQRRASRQPARPARRRRLRRARARDRAAARGGGRRPRRQRRPAAAGRRARDRQDPNVRGARHLRAGQRRPGLLGPLPRGRGRAGLLALGAGDPRLRARRRPRGDGLADGRRRRRDRPARARGGGAPRHRAGRSLRERGGALPPLRLGRELPGRRRTRPADGPLPRRPALGRRALAAAAQARRRRDRLIGPADRRHLPRRRARPPPSAGPGAG